MSVSLPNIYLLGPRASGKSTLGRLLARDINRPFVDMDQVAQWTAGESIAKLVAREGWEFFRDMERVILAGLHRTGGAVAATGGGVVLKPENRRLLKQGVCLLLWTSPEALVERLQADLLAEQRPSLTGEDPAAEMTRIMTEREPLYRECAMEIFDAGLPLETLRRQVLQWLKDSGGVQI